MDDLELLLKEALHQQSLRNPRRSRRLNRKPHEDYAKRLAERALYRRLINETDIAQDGIRFLWYFAQPRYAQEMSLDEWRRRIDREMRDAKQHPRQAQDATPDS